jgi:hypothetical protein
LLIKRLLGLVWTKRLKQTRKPTVIVVGLKPFVELFLPTSVQVLQNFCLVVVVEGDSFLGCGV